MFSCKTLKTPHFAEKTNIGPFLLRNLQSVTAKGVGELSKII